MPVAVVFRVPTVVHDCVPVEGGAVESLALLVSEAGDAGRAGHVLTQPVLHLEANAVPGLPAQPKGDSIILYVNHKYRVCKKLRRDVSR